MNRFFRSALFPLVVIVLLVYLASQTLMSDRSKADKFTYSELFRQVEAGNVSSVVFEPRRQQITAQIDGTGADGVDRLCPDG